MRRHIAIDFDGTVTLEDTTDVLLERLADPAWQTVEEEWLAGRIGSRECLARQAALLRATPEEIDDVLAGITIDPDFAAFVSMADALGATMEIVSDGFDCCILPLLERTGVRLPVTCNQLQPAGENRWVARFPASSPDCLSAGGVCKCRAAQSGRTLIVVGDGHSDFCLASRADFVLAKAKLATYCAEQRYPFQPIGGFADAVAWLRSLPAQQGARACSGPNGPLHAR